MRAWQEDQSQIRFAWEWSSLDDEQRKRLMGFEDDNNELNRILYWALVSKSQNWMADDFLIWSFDVVKPSGKFEARPYSRAPNPCIEDEIWLLWEQFLVTHFASDWHDNWFRKHKCVRQWIESRRDIFGYAMLESAPTAHEQLEAKLQLRDWLQDKATPAEIEQLLAI